MFNVPIGLRPLDRASAAAMRSQIPVKKTAAPKTDVIDLSRAPTPEQAERLRGAGILGYGSVTAEKTVTAERMGSGATVTHVTTDCRHEYFDASTGAVYQYESSGLGVFTSGGSAFMESAAQMTCTREDGSWWQAAWYESAFNLELGGHSSWYIPPRLNEDGSWSLAEYGPSAQFTVRGCHSVFSFTQSDGEQTRTFWSETFVGQVKGTIPGGPRPGGAEKLPPLWDYRDMADRLGRLGDHLPRGFDARA